ncbi:hypothetical protein [Micromonospora deserti]|uniref:Uncharacterized protein n=1 Tax=Micromonospora deserti TaxID=2070366 RepID=A0A2W2CDI0_9ACTN|nr:hypothetical protein [Micromonospora deserti]PZF86367.1 hypothetical protein C1I99_29005 [Micromonospora deserti]
MSQQNLTQMKTGEVAERARSAGVQNVEQMNKDQMIQAMGGGQPQSKQPGRGGGRGDAPQPKGTDPKQWKNVPGNQT